MARQARIALLEVLEQRVTQFRRNDTIFPFRRPHEPLDLARLILSALGSDISAAIGALRSRTVIEMEWPEGETWSAWVAMLPSGLHVYCDSYADEHRVLASVKRGSAVEADRFFLELLAESRGRHFGIEIAGGAPVRVRTPIPDRAFLGEVLLDLFEGTDVETEIRSNGPDFRIDVDRWLLGVLVAPPVPGRSKRYRRLRDEPSRP